MTTATGIPTWTWAILQSPTHRPRARGDQQLMREGESPPETNSS